jgi:hypothetical protein
MRFKSVVLPILVSSVLLISTGCSKAPDQEIGTAKAAIEAAKAVEADKYSADKFKAAEDALNAAIVEVEAQKSAFALSRNYDKAKTLLASVVSLAEGAKEGAAAEKEKVKAESETSVAAANALVAEVKGLLASAPKGKEGKEALEAISADIATIETSLSEASAAIGSGDFIGARDKAVAGTEKLESIKAELTAAIEKSKGKKGKK